MSKRKISKEIRIGLFFLLVLIALYFVIQFLKGNDVFQGTATYYAVYPGVEGLAPTSPVSILGLKAGTIDRISYDQINRKMIVRMKLKKSYKIPAGSVADIYSADILGGKAVKIILSEETDFHRSGDTLLSSVQKDLITLLTGELVSLKEQIAGLISGLDTTVAHLNEILGTENKQEIREALASLNSSLHQFNGFIGTLNDNAPRIGSILGSVDTLGSKLNTGMNDLNQTLVNLQALSLELKDAGLSETVNELTSLVKHLNNPGGSLGQVMNNPDLYNNITRVLGSVDSLVQRISDNPKKYFKITVF
ncbi:MAG: MlaD family protein [Bacteroidales bacterium]|jgi:phospholipid/cholesterol/gamma-HCH transport system substrate-binding protein|nr:MlaD family protein [Bacteroidales bacterium]MDD4256929.1 MlaD family protein [Bacteroidales bacterium]MDD4653802.1 MlaD family protein [Bacteroidales bacterium]MDD4828316.1 MlaD family protein [Bacteroidales bacterium]